MDKGFFEYLGLADMEKMHSQILAWLLSDNCTILNPFQKNQLFQKVTNNQNLGSIKHIYTEHKSIDILIETDVAWLVIENKLKSSQHSGQLKKYEKKMQEIKGAKEVHYIFLTLINENASNPWVNFSYRDLVNILSDFQLDFTTNINAIIFGEYFRYLVRLTDVVDRFLRTPNSCINVFKDGHLTKFEKAKLNYDGDQKFICENQLETILQKCYLSQSIARLEALHPDIDFSISETWGVAIIDSFQREKIQLGERFYKFGIQYQGGTWKFALSIADEYLKSDKQWVDNFVNIFVRLALEKAQGYHQYNKPDSKAWVSVSKKLEEEIYNITISDFVTLYERELEHLMILKGQVLKKIYRDGYCN